MTAPESHLLQMLCSLLVVVPGSYAVGRVHQWYTNSLRRDVAFREGYDHASHSIFDLAVQHRAVEPPGVEPPGAVPSRAAERPRTAGHARTRVIPRSAPGSGDRRRRDPLAR